MASVYNAVMNEEVSLVCTVWYALLCELVNIEQRPTVVSY